MKTKPNVFKSLLWLVPCLLVFVLSQTLSATLIAIVGAILSVIPFISTIFKLLLAVRGEPFVILIAFISNQIAYILTTLVQTKTMRDAPTFKLSRKILGVVMIPLYILLIVGSIISGLSFFEGNACIYIGGIISSLVFIFSNKSEEE